MSHLDQLYYEYIFLSQYYRYLAKQANSASGNRSPITGKQYTMSSTRIHHEAARSASKIKSKLYLLEAIKIRKEREAVIARYKRYAANDI